MSTPKRTDGLALWPALAMTAAGALLIAAGRLLQLADDNLADCGGDE